MSLPGRPTLAFRSSKPKSKFCAQCSRGFENSQTELRPRLTEPLLVQKARKLLAEKPAHAEFIEEIIDELLSKPHGEKS